MSFDVSKITDNGLQQLAAVSATKTLSIDSIICLGDAFDEEDVVTQPEAYWLNHSSKLTTVTGRVISAGENPNTTDTSRLVIELTATEDTTVKTLIVCAHTSDSGVSGNEGTFYGLSDSEGIEVLYNNDVTVKTQVAISFSFNRSSEITISEDTSASNYLLASEVGRFVTTHKAGDNQSGDNQNIRGVKTFYNGARFYDHVSIFDDKILYLDHIETNERPFIEVDGHIKLVAGHTLYTDNIGASDGTDGNVSIDDDTVINGNLDCQQDVGIAGSLVVAGGLEVNSDALIDGDTTFNGNITADGDGQEAFLNIAHVKTLKYNNDSRSITCDGSIVPRNDYEQGTRSNYTLGTQQNRFKDVYAEQVRATTVEAHNLNGHIPTPTVSNDTLSIPVGAIILGICKVTGAHKNIGDELWIQTVNINQYAVAKNNGGSWETSAALPLGKYRIISEYEGPADPNSNNTIFLAMRWA